MKILSIVSARPNFIKVAALHRAFEAHPIIESEIVHTGQHYDFKMSDIFINQLGLPKPHYYLGVAGGSNTSQKAKVMLKFEAILETCNPDIVVVVGDVNATVACAMTAIDAGIKTVHVEAGLRSGDKTMPEEINRIITDAICDLLFVTENSGLVNLAKENIPKEKVCFVGNVMIDSLIQFHSSTSKVKLSEIFDKQLNKDMVDIEKITDYILMTMHRPRNVDNIEALQKIIAMIKTLTKSELIVFPVHPRTFKSFQRHDLYVTLKKIKNLVLLPPQGYFHFLKLMDNSKLILTDSGGIQEESTFLKVPCITLRNATERPVTVELGTNTLIRDLNPIKILNKVNSILDEKEKKGIIPPLWDGQAAERITNILVHKYTSE